MKASALVAASALVFIAVLVLRLAGRSSAPEDIPASAKSQPVTRPVSMAEEGHQEASVDMQQISKLASLPLKTDSDSHGFSGLWLRVEGADGRLVAFDNMGAKERRLYGTTGWTASQLVLDVPATACIVNFGFVLSGTGRAWMDDVHVEVVDAKTPVTARTREYQIFHPVPRQQPPAKVPERRLRTLSRRAGQGPPLTA